MRAESADPVLARSRMRSCSAGPRVAGPRRERGGALPRAPGSASQRAQLDGLAPEQHLGAGRAWAVRAFARASWRGCIRPPRYCARHQRERVRVACVAGVEPGPLSSPLPPTHTHAPAQRPTSTWTDSDDERPECAPLVNGRTSCCDRSVGFTRSRRHLPGRRRPEQMVRGVSTGCTTGTGTRPNGISVLSPQIPF